MGKGSNRRKEDIAKIWDNWDAIFGKKDIKEEQLDNKQKQDNDSQDDTTKNNAK